MRLEAIGRDPSHAGQFAPTVHPAELGIAPLDLLKAGKAAFVRVADAAQPIICGSGASQGLQLQQLLGAFSTNLTTITAAVAGLLITQLAIAPAIASVVATLIVGKVAPKSVDALCRAWGQKIAAARSAPQGAPTTPH